MARQRKPRSIDIDLEIELRFRSERNRPIHLRKVA